jgi:hypothetical protein
VHAIEGSQGIQGADRQRALFWFKLILGPWSSVVKCGASAPTCLPWSSGWPVLSSPEGSSRPLGMALPRALGGCGTHSRGESTMLGYQANGGPTISPTAIPIALSSCGLPTTVVA